MFRITKEEFDMIFQIGTSSWENVRKLLFAFTELEKPKSEKSRNRIGFISEE